ncbi:MAG: DsbA family protein [Alphaproteobacteria bacterium]|nr:DsbA family protein [Alphaproteobacteria bacterium]
MKKKLLTILPLFLILISTSAKAENSFTDKIKSFFSKERVILSQTDNKSGTTDNQEPKALVEDSKSIEPNYNFSERTIGLKTAPVKMFIFTSLTCPHCVNLHKNLLPILKKDYADTGRALLVMKDFPLEIRAMTGSLVAHCLKDDNAYFTFMDTLYANQMQWATAPNLQEALAPLAKLAGLSEEEMKACATNEKGLQEIQRIKNLDIMQYKIRATPTVVIRVGKNSLDLVGLPSIQSIEETIAKLSDPNYIPEPEPDPTKTEEKETQKEPSDTQQAENSK